MGDVADRAKQLRKSMGGFQPGEIQYARGSTHVSGGD